MTAEAAELQQRVAALERRGHRLQTLRRPLVTAPDPVQGSPPEAAQECERIRKEGADIHEKRAALSAQLAEYRRQLDVDPANEDPETVSRLADAALLLDKRECVLRSDLAAYLSQWSQHSQAARVRAQDDFNKLVDSLTKSLLKHGFSERFLLRGYEPGPSSDFRDMCIRHHAECTRLYSAANATVRNEASAENQRYLTWLKDHLKQVALENAGLA